MRLRDRAVLATDEGRARFWAEATRESDGTIDFHFPDEAQATRAWVLANEPPHLFAIEYVDAETRFELADDGAGGTDLTLISTDEDRKTFAGWVSVLLSLKAAADFGVDLRNHDPARSWRYGYADN